MSTHARTAEHVSQAHPDKFCDQVADSILDAALDRARALTRDEKDPDHARHQRTAIEMVAKDYVVTVSGEIKFGPKVAAGLNVKKIVRDCWKRVGYERSWRRRVKVVNRIQQQSPDIAKGVDPGGAGDQGIMVGFATDATDTLMPLEYELARNLCRRIEELRVSGAIPALRADMKTQVTIDDKDQPSRVVIAVQHAENADQAELKNELMAKAVLPILGERVQPDIVIVNGTKKFTIGGTIGDAGVVGRKIVVDAYGPHIPVGGGAYSGKDPTKVDRSAAYMARHIAKTAVAMRIKDAKTCTVHIAYCIGQSSPDMLTAVTDQSVDISDWVKKQFPDLSPRGIIDYLDLLRLTGGDAWSYRSAAAFGHYGRPEFPWEKIAEVNG